MQVFRSSFVAALLAAAVALLAAASVLPARWALRLLPQNSLLAVADADGTIWQGQAWIALGYPETRRMLADPVQWQWRGLSIELRHPWLRGPITLTPRWGGVEISGQQAQLPASALVSLGAPWNTLSPTGRLELKWNAVSSRQPQAPGPLLDLAWRDAGSALSMSPLGDYHLSVASTGQALTLDLGTDKGPLELSGHGTWNGRKLTFQGQAKASDDATEIQAAQLSGLLSAIGPAQGAAHPFSVP